MEKEFVEKLHNINDLTYDLYLCLIDNKIITLADEKLLLTKLSFYTGNFMRLNDEYVKFLKKGNKKLASLVFLMTLGIVPIIGLIPIGIVYKQLGQIKAERQEQHEYEPQIKFLQDSYAINHSNVVRALNFKIDNDLIQYDKRIEISVNMELTAEEILFGYQNCNEDTISFLSDFWLSYLNSVLNIYVSSLEGLAALYSEERSNRSLKRKKNNT